MSHRPIAVLLAVVAAGTAPRVRAAAPASPAATAPAAAPLAEDARLTSASGATYPVSKGWWVTRSDGFTLLEDPDRELKLVLLELEAASADAAIAAAWRRFDPGFSRPVFQTVRPPAAAPWDEIAQSVYDVPAVEARAVLAVARRHGKTWHVALVDGTAAALGRRGAQVNTTVRGLRPAGGAEESLAGRAPRPLGEAGRAELERFVRDAMARARVPGVAVAVLERGAPVWLAGFGERELGKGGAIGPDTPFMIGSITKSLTTLMMAKLVDEGRFGWDTKVTALMPSFALGDADATRRLEMRHTVCACTGLPRQDMEFVFEWAKATPDDRLRQMRGMKPTTGFGETFQYSNTMVASGGYVAARAAVPGGDLEAAYERTMRERVFAPLGMASTTFDLDAAVRAGGALPHGTDLSLLTSAFPVAWEGSVRSVAPAGGAWSTARDLSRWVALELSKGVLPDGTRVVSEANLLARRAPMARISDRAHYGLGLFVGEDRGLRVVQHGGNTLGFTSLAFWLPDAGVGAVILTNAAGANAFTGAIEGRLVELWFGATPRAADGLAFAVRAREEGVRKVAERVAATPDPAWMRARAGRWREPALGEIEIRADRPERGAAQPRGVEGEEGGGFVLDAGEWRGRVGQLRDVNGDASLVLLSPPLAGLTVAPRQEGGEEVLVLDAGQQRYAFRRVR